jgi:hypothetical protein
MNREHPINVKLVPKQARSKTNVRASYVITSSPEDESARRYT